MNQVQRMRVAGMLAVLACAAIVCRVGWAQASAQRPSSGPAAAQGEPGLVIVNDSDLPDTYPRGRYELRLLARGGVPVLHWKVEKGALPPGIKLEDDGLLHGEAERTGEFQFTASVTDSNKPQQAVQKAFVIRVR